MPRAGVATIGHNRGMDGDVGGRLPQGAQETAGRRSGPRLLAAGALGLITGGVVLVTARHIDFALALGWSVAALAYLARTWWVIGRMDAVSTARHATVEDASNVLTLELVVLLASVAGFVGVIAAILSPSMVFAFLVNASGALIVFIYLAIAVSQVRVRRQGELAGKPPSALPMWLFPWLSYLAIAGMIAVLIAMAFTPSHQTEFWTSVVSVLVALAAYAVFRRKQRAPGQEQ